MIIVQLPDHLYLGGHYFYKEIEQMKINLKNEAGMLKSLPIGFSWTVLFFGPLVPLFCGDFKWFLLMYLPFVCWIMAFSYNKIYIQKYLM